MTRRRRWPGWVYGDGQEPDVRFSMANERTFLAWIRTSLALLAGGVAVDTVTLPWPRALQRSVAAVLVVLGMLAAMSSWWRWATAERAMRREEPLPATAAAAGLALALGVVLVAIVLLVASW